MATTTNIPNPLPRELAPGLFWLGGCLDMPYRNTILHTYDSTYLVRGDDATLLVEAGLPLDLDEVVEQLDALLVEGSPLRYLWATHQETPHAGGVGRLLHRYPDLQLVGDVHDYHLFFPELTDRMMSLPQGASLDLGGTEFTIVEPVIRDLITTQWGFDTRSRTLFPGDGFAYAHLHSVGQCGMTAEEVPALDVADMTGLFAEQSLNWARFTDMEPHVARLQGLLDELGVELIGPTHGLPITDLEQSVPQVLDGLRAAGREGRKAFS